MRPSTTAVRLYTQKVAEVIRELAGRGDLLVVGRGGQVVLAGEPRVLHVLVIAPRPMRLQTVQEIGIDPASRAIGALELREHLLRRIRRPIRSW